MFWHKIYNTTRRTFKQRILIKYALKSSDLSKYMYRRYLYSICEKCLKEEKNMRKMLDNNEKNMRNNTKHKKNKKQRQV